MKPSSSPDFQRGKARPGHESVCSGCDLIHPESMFRDSPIKGMGKSCAETRIKKGLIVVGVEVEIEELERRS